MAFGWTTGIAFWSTTTVETVYGLRFGEDVVLRTLAMDGAVVLGFLGGVMAEKIESMAQQMHPKITIREHRVGDR